MLSENKTVLQNVYTLFKFTLALHISSATCKKNFSVVVNLKTGSEHQCFKKGSGVYFNCV